MSYKKKADILNYFTPDVSSDIRAEIENAHGNEVLFFGWIDEEQVVNRVEVVSRGNDESTPVPLDEACLPDLIIHNHPDGNLTPSSHDINIASYIANSGVGFLIIDNTVTNVYVVVEPVRKAKIVPLNSRELMELLSSGSPLASEIPNFEEREGQKQMVAYVCDAFNDNSMALIEAGTGIGKSLAYLIPAVRWTLLNREKVIISTNTINLQEQLLYKDIPDLKKIIDENFIYLLMKGRGNYVCLNRLYEAQQNLFSLIEDDEIEQFEAILGWLNTTEEASLSHLPFVPKPSLWEKINSTAGTCLGGMCPYYSECPVNRVRRQAAKAHIIVTNHHYLIADAQLKGTGASLLPSCRRVIFDEAHNLEDSATSFFTRTVTLSGVLSLLGRLHAGSRKNRGYLVYLQRTVHFSNKRVLRDAIDETSRLRSEAFEFFENLNVFFTKILEEMGNTSESILEVNEALINREDWKRVVENRTRVFSNQCNRLINALERIREELIDVRDERARRQIEGFIFMLGDILQTLTGFLETEDDNYVRWIEKKHEIAISISIIEVGKVLNELVFERLKSCVLTSATLTVKNSFDFLKSRLGIKSPQIETILPSPFDYEAQMKVLIPTDIAEPGYPEYVADLCKSIVGILQKTGGRAFVLFTSYRTMNEVYEMVREMLAGRGYIIFKQGEDSRRNLLERFKVNVNSILFGTESFWEGVDAPGKTLECVIITKLPFKVPTEPIIKARFERIRNRGGNPFLNYYVPLAVIKLRQGIGRLIRNRLDRGVIVILDKRILIKSYGGFFLSAIPTETPFCGKLYDVLREIEEFLSINT
ncbi:MAG: helicase C-terminal domain-containing protein [Spirochaetota bacterium]